MNITEEIQYKGFDLRISFDYYKGYAGSFDRGACLSPPEPEMIEIELVELLNDLDGDGFAVYTIVITDLLTETQLKEIEELLWNKKENK